MASVLNDINTKNEIEESEFSKMTKHVYGSFLLNQRKSKKSDLDKQIILISLFSQMLEKYLELQMLNDKQLKIEFINFIDKLNLQKELLDLQKGKTELRKIRTASRNLGRKAQSAFKAR